MHQRTWLSLLTFPLVAAFTYPVMVNRGAATPPPATKGGENTGAVQDPLAGLSDVQDVMTLIRENYVDVPDMDKVIDGGIQGALERVHPLNAYLSAADLRLPDPGVADGGFRLLKRGIYGQVIAVSPQGPAAKAGLQVGDIVRKINGQSMGPLSTWHVERLLKGPENSEMKILRYAASDKELKELTFRRTKPVPAPVMLRQDTKATVLEVPDLNAGRAMELFAACQKADPKLPLVLDLRHCADGDREEAAKVAGFFLGQAPFLTVQEAGKADVAVGTVGKRASGFQKVTAIMGLGTFGAPEALCAALKKGGISVMGERSLGMGVVRNRFLLRQGGAVEMVNKRWLGAGGEKLDRQGVEPVHVLKWKPGETIVPKVLEHLDKAPDKRAEARSDQQAIAPGL